MIICSSALNTWTVDASYIKILWHRHTRDQQQNLSMFVWNTHHHQMWEQMHLCISTALWTVVVVLVDRNEDKEETGSPLQHTISQLCLNKDISFVFTLRWHINDHILCSTNCLHEVHRRGLFNCWTPCCVESIWDWMKCICAGNYKS